MFAINCLSKRYVYYVSMLQEASLAYPTSPEGPNLSHPSGARPCGPQLRSLLERQWGPHTAIL